MFLKLSQLQKMLSACIDLQIPLLISLGFTVDIYCTVSGVGGNLQSYRYIFNGRMRRNYRKKIAKISITKNCFLFPFFASGNYPTFRCVGGLQTTRWHPTCWSWLCKAECCLFVSISSHRAYTKPSGALFDGRDLGTLEQGQSQLSGRFFLQPF